MTHQSEGSISRIVIKDCVIKGYHHFKIRLPYSCNFQLRVEKEYSNINDNKACLIWIPEEIPNNMALNMITDEKRHLTLGDILGLPCGHVPRGLAPAFRTILDAGGTIFAEATDKPIPSFPPWPQVMDNGGGIVIPCDFIVYPTDLDSALETVKEHIQNMAERDVIKVFKL